MAAHNMPETRHTPQRATEGAYQAVGVMCEHPERSQAENERTPLTPREREVYELAVQGMSIRDMADRLYIEPGTVKSYLWQIRAWRGVTIPNRVPHRHLPVPAPDDRLRPSERRVCELARRGYTNVQIGERLGISPNVVRLHLHTARQRAQELEAAS